MLLKKHDPKPGIIFHLAKNATQSPGIEALVDPLPRGTS